MIFEVYNLNQILKKVKKGGNLISIRDKICGSDTQVKYDCLDRRIARYGVNALTVNFDDIDPYRFYHDMEHFTIKAKFADGKNQPIFFNPEIAGDIMSFVKSIWEKDRNSTVRIHCWAGRSRSQAVAYWLNMFFNLRLDKNIEHYIVSNTLNVHDKVHFNCEVLKVFTQVYG